MGGQPEALGNPVPGIEQICKHDEEVDLGAFIETLTRLVAGSETSFYTPDSYEAFSIPPHPIRNIP